MPCDSPLYVKTNKFRTDIPVPCGKCPPCLKRRVDAWVFRLTQEDRLATASHFVTLTYDTRSVPISANGFMTLKKSDFQNFMKRLRKNTRYPNIKYYACGEYGTNNKRPHYHAIIFNCPTVVSYAQAWALDEIAIGQIDVGQVSGDSIAYVCKYMQKAKQIPEHKRDDRLREFSLMSKGLGAGYLSGPVVNYHKTHVEQMYLTVKDGFKIALPKYYRDKIFSDEEKTRQLYAVKTAMDEQSEKLTIQLSNKGIDPDLWLYERKVHRYLHFVQQMKKRKL